MYTTQAARDATRTSDLSPLAAFDSDNPDKVPVMPPRKFKNGQVFGRLTLTKAYAELRGRFWCHELKCECGNITTVHGSSLTSGATKSCGCFNAEQRFGRNKTHGKTHSLAYISWAGMIQRCTNPKATKVKRYSARGIKVCDRWLNSFENFYADMGDRPSTKYSLDRIDNDGNYEPTNCRWATAVEQGRNKGISEHNKTGVSGVDFRSDIGKYVARITADKRINLGCFDTIEEATQARKAGEAKYW